VNIQLPRRLSITLLVGSLTACTTVGPNYEIPKDSAYQRPQANGAFLDTGNDRIQPSAPLPERWWSLYRSPVLDSLVETALRDNVELKVAVANLHRADAMYRVAEDAAGPDFEVDASAERARLSGESLLQEEQLPVMNLGEAKVGVSYLFDMFGKLKRGEQAAHADSEAAQAALDLAKVALVARVTGSYVGICHANHELVVAQHSVDLQKRGREVAQRLVSAGRGTPPDLARAEAQVATLEAALPPLRAKRQAAEYQLTALLGRTPGQLPEGVADCQQPPEINQPIPIGDGRALLARRPDVREAERRLAAATARIGVATADMYPQIRFGASVGAIGTIGSFGSPATQMFGIGPLISWSIPGKAAHARVRAAEAGADAAVAQFDHTVLEALREVQTALSQYAQDLQRLQSLRQAQQQADLAAAQNRRLYQAGRNPYLTSLDADRSLASADITLATAEAQVAQDQIQLFLALGGGWKEDASSHSR
jgi:NodT family efflux transporter outer membrane factor (OMF) lipoprotein